MSLTFNNYFKSAKRESMYRNNFYYCGEFQLWLIHVQLWRCTSACTWNSRNV